MNKLTGSLLVVVLVQLVSISCNSPAPCICTKEYLPVCGTDHKTYSNKCLLKCASDENVKNNRAPILISSHRKCPNSFQENEKQDLFDQDKSIDESYISQPDDENQGKEANDDQITQDNKDKVIQDDKDQVTEGDNDQVTQGDKEQITQKDKGQVTEGDNDQVTQGDKEQITQKDKGQVTEGDNDQVTQGDKEQITQKDKGQVTEGDNDQVTQGDKDQVTKDDTDQATQDEKKEIVDEGCFCIALFDPVCASDNKTYGNSCQLGCENKRRKKLHQELLTQISKGECDYSCICTLEYKPVCATNGILYENSCKLDCESKRLEREGYDPIQATGNYECVKVDCPCTREYNPVCGEDTITYSNPCTFKCENKRRAEVGLKPILKDYDGECDVCICTLEYAPVCGTDGKTYGNKCALECENKKRKRNGKNPIKIRNNGECKKKTYPHHVKFAFKAKIQSYE